MAQMPVAMPPSAMIRVRSVSIARGLLMLPQACANAEQASSCRIYLREVRNLRLP